MNIFDRSAGQHGNSPHAAVHEMGGRCENGHHPPLDYGDRGKEQYGKCGINYNVRARHHHNVGEKEITGQPAEMV